MQEIINRVVKDSMKKRGLIYKGPKQDLTKKVIVVKDKKTSPYLFMCSANKSNAHIAAEMADDIKEVIYKHADKIPLALAIGVLRIVEKEILDDS